MHLTAYYFITDENILYDNQVSQATTFLHQENKIMPLKNQNFLPENSD